MKQLKSLTLTLLISLLILVLRSATLSAQENPQIQQIEQRVDKLEGEKDLRDGEVRNIADALRNDFNELQASSQGQSYRIWLAIALGVSGLGLSIFSILKFAKGHALKIVQSQLDQDLPPMVQQKMEESFDRLLRKHSQTILNVVGKHDRIEGYKKDKRILILTENEKDSEKITKLIGGLGFEKIKTQVAVTFDGVNEYDLVIIARAERIASACNNLSDDRIWDFYDSLPKDKVFMYYGPNSDRLNSIPRDRIHFTNIVFTVQARILEVFEYQHAMANGQKVAE